MEWSPHALSRVETLTVPQRTEERVLDMLRRQLRADLDATGSVSSDDLAAILRTVARLAPEEREALRSECGEAAERLCARAEFQSGWVEVLASRWPQLLDDAAVWPALRDSFAAAATAAEADVHKTVALVPLLALTSALDASRAEALTLDLHLHALLATCDDEAGAALLRAAGRLHAEARAPFLRALRARIEAKSLRWQTAAAGMDLLAALASDDAFEAEVAEVFPGTDSESAAMAAQEWMRASVARAEDVFTRAEADGDAVPWDVLYAAKTGLHALTLTVLAGLPALAARQRATALDPDLEALLARVCSAPPHVEKLVSPLCWCVGRLPDVRKPALAAAVQAQLSRAGLPARHFTDAVEALELGAAALGEVDEAALLELLRGGVMSEPQQRALARSFSALAPPEELGEMARGDGALRPFALEAISWLDADALAALREEPGLEAALQQLAERKRRSSSGKQAPARAAGPASAVPVLARRALAALRGEESDGPDAWLGLSLHAMRLLREHPAYYAGMTTGDMLGAIVKPLTSAAAAGRSCSLAELLRGRAGQEALGDALRTLGRPGGHAHGRPLTARYATQFVSHSWRYSFDSVLDSLTYGTNATYEEDPYFWFDLLSVNQHEAPQRPASWWDRTFRDGVGAFGVLSLVVDQLERPTCLTRIWCIWEVFCALDAGAHIMLCFPWQEEQRAVASVQRGADAVSATVRAVDVARAEATVEADKARILAAVERAASVRSVNERVRGFLAAHLVAYAAHLGDVRVLEALLAFGPDTTASYMVVLERKSMFGSAVVQAINSAAADAVSRLLAYERPTADTRDRYALRVCVRYIHEPDMRDVYAGMLREVMRGYDDAGDLAAVAARAERVFKGVPDVPDTEDAQAALKLMLADVYARPKSVRKSLQAALVRRSGGSSANGKGRGSAAASPTAKASSAGCTIC